MLESPASFVNAMEGAALRIEREYDLALAQAWHGAKFNGLAQAGKLRRLSQYVGRKSSKPSPASSALAFFHRMKAAGFPVEIRRTERSRG